MTMKKRNNESGIVTVMNDYPVSEAVKLLLSHRTCWIHTVMVLHQRGKKIRRKELERINLASPCSLLDHSSVSPCFILDPSLQRERSKRRIKRKDVIPKEIGEKEKLSSGVFDTYFEYLWASFAEDKKISFTYLESIWFHYYTTTKFKEKVLTWIKTKEIFLKKYVLVPIVHWGHWCLLILCHLGESCQSTAKTPCILLLDSLEMANPKRYEPIIRKFVSDIYKSENKDQISRIPFLVPKVPQQRNNADCGNYVLYFIKLFVQHAPDNFSIDDYPYFMNKNWFAHECLERFLEELESSLSSLRRRKFFEQMKSVKYEE